MDTLKARAVADVCGFGSVAMLDYLERSGVFQPEIRRQKNKGKPRKYTFRDVLVLKAIAILLRNGASVAALKESLSFLQKARWRAEEAVLEDSLGSLRHLIFSGGKIYLPRSEAELIELTFGGQLAFSFIIDLDQLHSTLQREWRQSRIGLQA
jgi:hypothetical protein